LVQPTNTDENNAKYDNNDLGKPIDTKQNHIYGLLIGAGVEKGSVDNTFYNHYSQIAFLQQEWCIGTLNRNDTTADSFTLMGTPTKKQLCKNKPHDNKGTGYNKPEGTYNVLYNGASATALSAAVFLVALVAF
jgi:Phosphoesterase family